MGYDERIQRLETRYRDSAGHATAPEVSFAETLRQRMHARADGEDVPVDEREAQFRHTIDIQIANCCGLGWELLQYVSGRSECGEKPRSEEEAQRIIQEEQEASRERLERCEALPRKKWQEVYEERNE